MRLVRNPLYVLTHRLGFDINAWGLGSLALRFHVRYVQSPL